MATFGVNPDDGGLQGLMEASPDRGVHTSAAAEIAFLLGLIAVASSLFSLTYAMALAAGVLGLVSGVVGLASTSRPYVAGQALAPLGLVLGCLAIVLVGLRYLGVDTAVGEDLLPTLQGWLESLNARVPGP
jgi:hypothetical protein